MKKSIKYILPVVLLVLASTGCKKELNDAAVNNNQPSTVTPSVMLTSSEATLGFVLGGDLSRFEGLFDQQMTAGASARQFTSYATYNFATSDFNNTWYNLYSALLNLKNLRNQSTAKGYNVYAGIADVLMAQSWGAITDVWGDVPYREALQGATILQPKVDAQKLVYDSIQGLLDSAIARLTAATPGNLTPSTDDLIYGGDAAKWTRLAYSLKARYYLHLRKVDPSAIAKAVAASANGLSANSDDAYIGFGNSSASGSPWSQFSQNRQGELSFIGGSTPMMSTLMSTMYANNDPRIPGFIDTAQADAGNQYDEPSAFFGNYIVNNGYVAIMTYAEQLFINAELDSVQGNPGQAATDYNAAVTASVNAFGASSPNAAAYLAANANETAATINLNKIMTQKWIALFLNPEAFTDWRRTGYPVLSPNPGATTAIPRRFYYPQQEIAGNSHIAAISGSVQLVSRVWWDVQ
jgi:hypothetical protein